MVDNLTVTTRTTGDPKRLAFALFLLVSSIGLICAPAVLQAGELHDAVRANDELAVETLLSDGIDINETDFVLGTALHLSVSARNREMASILIKHGADLEAVSELQGARALHLAAKFGDAEIAVLLLDSGADIEARDDHNRTPLHLAAAEGHVGVVRLLLDRGAEVDVREGKYGGTPLHQAAFRGHPDVVKLLLDRGADIHATDNSGLTALAMAAYPQSYSRVEGAALLEFLVSKGADPNTKDTSGLSPLVHAKLQAANGDLIYPKIVDALRRLGATE